MVELSNDPMMAAMQRSQMPKTEEVVTPEAKAETPIAEEIKIETPIVKEEVPVAKVEEIKEEVPKVEKVVEQVKVKTFDEEFSEKFDGKYKSVDEIKALLNTPKEEFADEKIKHWNDLAKKGIKIDKEFLELQSKDFESMDDPISIRIEAMKLKPEYRGLSDKTIELKLNKEYSMSEWLEKDEVDLTDEDKANREILMRDAGNDKQWLINYKNERVLEKQVDPKVSEAMAEEARINQNNWENFVDSDLVNKVTKLSIPVNDKGDLFEYEFSEQDRKETAEIMKALPKDSNVFFGQFLEKDKEGNVIRNHSALYQMMLKAKNYEKAVSLAYADGVSKEALRAEKEGKNTNFKAPEAGSEKPTFKTVQEAQAAAVQKAKI